MKKRSYFLDSNVIVSGVVWDGNERRILELGSSQEIELVTCSYVLSEMERALSKLGYSPTRIIEVLIFLRGFVRITDPTENEIREYWTVLPDKSDVPILAAAIKSKGILVTGDKRFAKKAGRYVSVESASDIVERF